LTRQLPNFRPSRLTVIAVGGAFCLAAAGSVSAVTLSSYGTPSDAMAAAAGLTSMTSQAQQRNAVQTMSAAVQRAEAEQAAAREARAAHAAHQRHAQILAAAAKKAAAEKAAAQKAAEQKAAAQKAARQKAAQSAQDASAAQPSGSPRQIAQELLDAEGEGSQFSCLDPLWGQESGWSVSASNPGSGAYGIPQALPGSKMASAGPDWQTNAETQIKWGLQYIQSTYGSPCAAWSHEQSDGWY
jgi:hypothetical protein